MRRVERVREPEARDERAGESIGPRGGRHASVETDWRGVIAGALRSREDLAAALALDPAARARLGSEGAREAARRFAVRVPRELVERMRSGDANDPLLRQFAPAAEETVGVSGYVTDPLDERAASPVPGVLHKYRGRVLLVVTGACPVHCRYCFRRHFPYGDHALSEEALDAALAYVAADSTIREVILSGGDPLSLADDGLAALEERLGAIAHLRRLRIHTRWPIVAPRRVTEELLAVLGRSRLRPVMVLHCNHAAEIDEAVRLALARLRGHGVTLLNQSVLLRGVNDSAEALCELSEALHAAGVLPYYLHLLDPVEGTAHFAVGESEARRLLRSLTDRLPGYLVPKLAREEAGASAKTVIPPAL
jgi:EF-P beta-lysylation protein EpmB